MQKKDDYEKERDELKNEIKNLNLKIQKIISDKDRELILKTD